jgi:hypothetical protein
MKLSDKKTDNHNQAAKLAVRRYFLRKYHGHECADMLEVLDCCQGVGTIWRALRQEFVCDTYLGVDLKPLKGRLKIDSVRLLDQAGWKYNVIDVDTYGAPWKHWFALLRHAPHSLTVFLTIGIVNIGGISSQADNETMRILGLDTLFAKCKARGLKPAPSLTGLARDRVGLSACLDAARGHGFTLAECVEAENEGGSARYIGVRLVRQETVPKPA